MPAVHDVPGRAGSGRAADARRPTPPRSTSRATALQKALEDTGRDRRRARSRPATPSPSRSRPIRRRSTGPQATRVRHVHDRRATTVKTDAGRARVDQGMGEAAREREDGQLLFEANCARCHTAGWSTFDSDGAARSARRRSTASACPAAAAASAAASASTCATATRSGASATTSRAASRRRSTFVEHRLDPLQGVRRHRHRLRPHARLRQDADDRSRSTKIVSYERYCLDTSTFLAVAAGVRDGARDPRTPPTTTTTTHQGGGMTMMMHLIAEIRRARPTRTSGTRPSSACSSCSRRSASSAVRPTCCSPPTSAPASASSSRSRRSPGSWCCSRRCGGRRATAVSTRRTGTHRRGRSSRS